MVNKSLEDILKQQEEESMMSEMTPADYENMQSLVAPEVITPQAAPIASPKMSVQKSAQPEVPMLAEAETQPTPPSETPMSKSEALIAEYQKMLGRDQKNLEDARSRDRMLKVGGSIGDALATYLNAKSQMNVKAPGVQVQQGAGLGKVADMFATAPEIQSDVATRREALMRQYAELARGERAQTRMDAQKQIAEERNKALREAAQIRAGAKGAEKPLTPYQQYMIDKSEKKEAKLSDKQTAELEGLGNVMRSLDEVQAAKEGVNTGRYASAIQSGREALPFSEADQDFVKLRQLSGTQLFDYVKNQSGVSYSVKELEQLKSNMPNVDDDDNTFLTKLNTVRDIVRRKQEEKIKAFQGQGKNVSGFKQEQSEETKTHPITGRTLKKVPGGWEEVD
jgi:hypothetical protein